MTIVGKIARAAAARYYRRLARVLERADPRSLMAAGERRAIRVFRRAARSVPAYRRLLEAKGVDPRSVRTIEDFKAWVPIVDKRSLFASHELREVCVGGGLDDFSLIYSSSGHSGTFSFGGETRRQVRAAERRVEFLLETTFRALSRKTLVINCLSSGVKVPTGRIPRAETSVRPDVVLALIEKLRNLLGHALLNLQTPGEHLHDARALAQANQLAIGDVSHMQAPHKGQMVMLAQAIVINITHDGHFTVSYIKDRIIDQPVRVHSISGDQLLIHARDMCSVFDNSHLSVFYAIYDTKAPHRVFL